MLEELKKTLELVKEEHLTKTQLESYHSLLTNLFAECLLEMAILEKAEATFFLEKTAPDVTDVSIKRMWRGSPNGLKLIDYKNYAKAIEKMLSSLKNRMYTQY